MSAYARKEGENAEEHATRLQKLLEIRDAVGASPEPPAVVEPFVEAEGEGRASLEEAEALLAERSQSAQNPAVLQLLAGLQAAAVYTDTPNHETNRKLWDAYAKDWAPDKQWVQRMAGHLPGGGPPTVSCVGEEWSDEASLDYVLQSWLYPHLEANAMVVAEVGSGGGRIAAKVAPKVKELVCFDISAEMLSSARKHLAAIGSENVRFQRVDGDKEYPSEFGGQFDLVYCFDVLVHCDLHQMRRTLLNIRRTLRPGGMLFVSFANLLAPDGWQRFARQKNYSVGGFYFISPDIVRCLLARCGLEIVKISAPEQGNTYLNRDLLVLARRPAIETETQGAVATGGYK